jgi:hypothetical protein
VANRSWLRNAHVRGNLGVGRKTMTRRRASREITLVLAGATMLQGCSLDPASDLVRDHYTTREECAADWGRPDWCEQTQRAGSSGGYYFRGPAYYAGTRDNAQNEARTKSGLGSLAPSNRSISRSLSPTTAGSTARGGFGASARGFSGGG